MTVAAAMTSCNRAAVLAPPFVIGILTGFTLLILQQSLSTRILRVSSGSEETAPLQIEQTLNTGQNEAVSSFEENVPFRYNTSAAVVEGKLNIHLVAHSHDDLGWLKTIDQYYDDTVQYIIETVIDQLSDNPDRKFIQVEQAFFYRWWQRQQEPMRGKVRKLVASGQLEFINGGWVMHDEACTHYSDMVHQMSMGHRFIKENFNITPRIAWQIDPFGHSATQASLIAAKCGLDAVFIGRVDQQEKHARMAAKTMEFVWRADGAARRDSQVLGMVSYDGYYSPQQFRYQDSDGSGYHLQDNPYGEAPNVKGLVDQFVAEVTMRAKGFKTKHLLFPMGEDFSFDRAIVWFKNMDKLIHYVNLDGRVNVLYSTPSVYLDALHSANATWPLKTGDMFPYAEDGASYWTGYFSSRPTFKQFARSCSSLLLATTILEAAVGKQALQAWGMATGRMVVLEHLSFDPHMGASTLEEKQAGHVESGEEERQEEQQEGGGSAASKGGREKRANGSSEGRGGKSGEGWEGGRKVRVASTFRLEEAVAVVQHHDGITGTAQQHVNDDYCARLHRAAVEASAVLTSAITHLITRGAIPKSLPNASVSPAVEFTFKPSPTGQGGWGWNQVGLFNPPAFTQLGAPLPPSTEYSGDQQEEPTLEPTQELGAAAAFPPSSDYSGEQQQEVDYADQAHDENEAEDEQAQGMADTEGTEDPLLATEAQQALGAAELQSESDGAGEQQSLGSGLSDGPPLDGDQEGFLDPEQVFDAESLQPAEPVMGEEREAGLVGLSPGGPEQVESSSTAADGTSARPAVEATRPAVDGTRAAADGTRSAADGTRAAADGTRASADGTGSSAGAEGSRPDGRRGQEVVASRGRRRLKDGRGGEDAASNEDSTDGDGNTEGGRQQLPLLDLKMCPLLNLSHCPPSESALQQGQTLVVVAINPLAWPRSEVIRFPVSSPNLLVTDASGSPIPSQVLRETLLSPTTRATYIAAYTGTGGTGGEEVGEEAGEEGEEAGEEGEWKELEDGQWPQPSQQRKRKHRKRQEQEQKEEEQQAVLSLVFRAEVPPLGYATFFVSPATQDTPGRAHVSEAWSNTAAGTTAARSGAATAQKKPSKAERGGRLEGGGWAGLQGGGGTEEDKTGGGGGGSGQEGVDTVVLGGWQGAGASGGGGAAGASRDSGKQAALRVSFSKSALGMQRMELVSPSASGSGEISHMSMPVNATMMEYASYSGGAYIFEASQPAEPITKRGFQVPIHIQRGPIVEEFTRKVTPWISEVFRVYPGQDYAELHYSVGPLPAKGRNHEVMARFTAPINSSRTFYSDSNGRSYIKRVVDYRLDWKLQVSDPIGGNYYPLTVGAFIKDKAAQLSVLVDRAAGAASLAAGQLEVMLHRALQSLDGKGVGEPLQESITVEGKTRPLTVVGALRFGLHATTDPKEGGKQGKEGVGLGRGSEWRRQHAQRLISPLQLAFALQTQESIKAAQGSYTWHYSLSQPSSTSRPTNPDSAFSYAVPLNVAVISLQELSPSEVVVRLAHLYEPGEHAALSRPAHVDLRRLFAARKIQEVAELSLMANQRRAEMRQPLSWQVQGEDEVGRAGDSNNLKDTASTQGPFVDPATLVVELGPAEIRTFSIRLQAT
ncbi:hypothetical protein CLOM_g14142 [Closterium sp. NIES-68]|nr:hypothetical protein CLOM_g14142 [Closterium sp. NIES-68]